VPSLSYCLSAAVICFLAVLFPPQISASLTQCDLMSHFDHPVTAWADHGPGGNGEPLAIVLRVGTPTRTLPLTTSRRRS
jgi:hypothetical protein